MPHIWPGFGQMWESTNAGARGPVAPEDFQGEIREFPHLAKTGPDMGHPHWWYRNIPRTRKQVNEAMSGNCPRGCRHTVGVPQVREFAYLG